MTKKYPMPRLRQATVFNVDPKTVRKMVLFVGGNPDIEDLQVVEPEPTQWRAMGLSLNRMFPHVSANAVTFGIDVFERILPSNVVDEAMRKRADALEQKTGRKCSRKDFAILKEEAQLELLPKAFIKRQTNLITFTGSHMIVWHASGKRVDELCIVMQAIVEHAFAGAPVPANIPQDDLKGSVPLAFKRIATNDATVNGFKVGTDAVLVNPDNEEQPKFTIKNKSVESDDVQHLLESGYSPTKIQLVLDETTQFKVNDKLIFSNIKFLDFSQHDRGTDMEDDDVNSYLSVLFLAASAILKARRLLVAEVNGEDEDDEL